MAFLTSHTLNSFQNDLEFISLDFFFFFLQCLKIVGSIPRDSQYVT